jgi:hypothetical protein
LLERLQRTHGVLGGAADRTRLHLVTTYPIDHTDTLAKIVSRQEGAIRFHQLAQGGRCSATGRVRTMWREHLRLKSDEELFELLQPLRLWPGAHDLARIQAELDCVLPTVGLRPTEGDGAVAPYDDLIWKLHAEGTHYFTEGTLRAECDRAGISTPVPEPAPRPHAVGVRSFKRAGVDMADSVDEYISLLDSFDGRFLLPDVSWAAVFDDLKGFFEEVVTRQRSFDVQLDTHASLAFASGFVLDPKRGLDLRLVQHSRAGIERWATSVDSSGTVPELTVESTELGKGHDVALALAITHDIVEDVKRYVTDSSLPCGRLIAVRPSSGAGQSAVRDAEHALAMADEIGRVLKGRSTEEHAAVLHVFAAAPNGLVFFLGQLGKGLGPLSLYEFDF